MRRYLYNLIAHCFERNGLNITKSRSGFFLTTRPSVSDFSSSNSGGEISNVKSLETVAGLEVVGDGFTRLSDGSDSLESSNFLLK